MILNVSGQKVKLLAPLNCYVCIRVEVEVLYKTFNVHTYFGLYLVYKIIKFCMHVTLVRRVYISESFSILYSVKLILPNLRGELVITSGPVEIKYKTIVP